MSVDVTKEGEPKAQPEVTPEVYLKVFSEDVRKRVSGHKYGKKLKTKSGKKEKKGVYDPADFGRALDLLEREKNDAVMVKSTCRGVNALEERLTADFAGCRKEAEAKSVSEGEAGKKLEGLKDLIAKINADELIWAKLQIKYLQFDEAVTELAPLKLAADATKPATALGDEARRLGEEGKFDLAETRITEAFSGVAELKTKAIAAGVRKQWADMKGDVDDALQVKSTCKAVTALEVRLRKEYDAFGKTALDDKVAAADGEKTLAGFKDLVAKIGADDLKWAQFMVKHMSCDAAVTALERYKIDTDDAVYALDVRDEALGLAHQGDFGKADSRIDVALDKLPKAVKGKWKVDAVSRLTAVENAKRGFDADAYGTPPPKTLADHYQKLATAGGTLKQEFDDATLDFDKMIPWLDTVDQLLVKIRSEVNDLAKDVSSAKTPADKALVKAALETVYNVKLKSETTCQCGKFQAGVNNITVGFECNECGKKVLEPAWSKKALPRLFKVLAMVPASHTTGNDRMLKIDRHRNSGGDASFYDGRTEQVVLNLERTGGFRLNPDDFGSANTVKYRTKGKKTGPIVERAEVSHFDVTTLHEVGHAVDAKMAFMTKRMKDAKYGNWRTENQETVIEVAGSKLGFFQDFKNLPRVLLKKYLEGILTNKDPAATFTTEWDKTHAVIKAVPEMQKSFAIDPGLLYLEQLRLAVGPIKDGSERGRAKDEAEKLSPPFKLDQVHAPTYQVVQGKILDGSPLADELRDLGDKYKTEGTPPDRPDADALAKHKAVKWCAGIRCKKDNGLWDKSDSGAKEYEVDGRVYQESYESKYISYDIAARAKRVNNYQFRSEAEWFAEIYALYYLGEMSKSHPDYDWFHKEVHLVS
jgi:hypothetical protein